MVLAPEFPIHTDRLLLRPIDASTDVDAVFAYQSRADVCRFIPYEPQTREQVAAKLRDPDKGMRRDLTEAGQGLDLAVVRQDSGELIGEALLMWHSAEHRGGEIGYVFNPDHHGHGFATEAARALLSLGFDGLALHRITARIDARNPASARVLTRLGMRHEATLVDNEWFKGEWSTEQVFAMLDSEWSGGVGLGGGGRISGLHRQNRPE